MFLQRQIRSDGQQLSSAQRIKQLHFSEIKQQNDQRLEEERKNQRESLERIRKQTQTEIDFLQSR